MLLTPSWRVYMLGGGRFCPMHANALYLQKRTTVWKTRLLQYEIRQVGKWKRYNEDWCRHRRVFIHITTLFADSSHAKLTLLMCECIVRTFRQSRRNRIGKVLCFWQQRRRRHIVFRLFVCYPTVRQQLFQCFSRISYQMCKQ